MPATIVPKNVTYKSAAQSIPTALFLPASGTSDKLVILAYGSDGLIDNKNGKWKTMLEKFARDLAQAGIAAAIPDYFASTGTGAGALKPDNLESYTLQIMQGQANWVAALKDGVSALAKPALVPGIQPARVGLLGFSLGGYLCAQAAAGVPAMVLFYTPVFLGLKVPGPLTTKVEMHYGTDDRLTSPNRDGQGVQAALQQAGATVMNLHLYDKATHGFAGSAKANKEAHKKSKDLTLKFFAANL